MKKRFAALPVPAVFILSACISCGPFPDLRDFSGADILPPVLTGACAESPAVITVVFNEDIKIGREPELSPDTASVTCSADGNTLRISTEPDMIPGRLYTLRASVTDGRGNTNDFMLPLYGYNPDIPEIIINEFTCQGSGKHPDCAELLALSGGNLAGLCVRDGTGGITESMKVLPDVDVEAGDYIIIHFKPEGVPEEIDETAGNTAESGGLDASDSALDFWVAGSTGLGGNNGALTLYSSPGGRLLDAVLYSNRTSASDEKYGGFGSTAMQKKAEEIAAEGGWLTEGGGAGQLRPEDAVDPEDSTATRSICRKFPPEDTGTKNDWHIVPGGALSFGSDNSNEVYVKP